MIRYLPPKTQTGQEEQADERMVNRRLLVLRGVVIAIFVLFVLRLWYLQILTGERYQVKADELRFKVVDIEAPRGLIYARDGELLVHNAPGYQVSIVIAYLPDDEDERMRIYQRLSELLGIPASGRIEAATEELPELPAQALSMVTEMELIDRLEVLGSILDRRLSSVPEGFEKGIKEKVEDNWGVADYRPVLIQSNVDRETALLIAEESLELPGVRVDVVPNREYPTGALTAHVVGYTHGIPEHRAEYYESLGYNPNVDQVGFTGIELEYEDVLRGTKGQRYIEEDATGRVIRVLGEPQEPVPGNNVILSLDLALQRYATERLQRTLDDPNIKSRRGVVIAMDPRNGQILALVSLPSYDNNIFANGLTKEDMRTYQLWFNDPYVPLMNHAIAAQPPPGSIFKIIPAAAALQEGVIDRNTHIMGEGVITIPDKYYPNDPGRARDFVCWIYLAGGGSHGSLDVVGGLANSCDIFFYKVGGGFEPSGFEGLGDRRLSAYTRLFGLGRPTGIDLPFEAAGLAPDRTWKRRTLGESWSTGDTYIMAIGQGFVLATPIQMLNATAAVANGGTLYQPQLLRRVTDQEGNVLHQFQPVVSSTLPIDPVHLATVREGMEAAVVYGTAPEAQLEGIRVAGKTGTAEYYCPDQEYKAGLCHRGRPQPTHAWFTAFAPVENPEIVMIVWVYNGGEGSQVAVPIAHDILKWYFDRQAAQSVPPAEGEPAPAPEGQSTP